MYSRFLGFSSLRPSFYYNFTTFDNLSSSFAVHIPFFVNISFFSNFSSYSQHFVIFSPPPSILSSTLPCSFSPLPLPPLRSEPHLIHSSFSLTPPSTIHLPLSSVSSLWCCLHLSLLPYDVVYFIFFIHLSLSYLLSSLANVLLHHLFHFF